MGRELREAPDETRSLQTILSGPKRRVNVAPALTTPLNITGALAVTIMPTNELRGR